jgi:hypothetical protein
MAVRVEQEYPNVDDALATIGHHRGVLADSCAATERLDADQFDGIIEGHAEDVDGVGAYAGLDDLRQVPVPLRTTRASMSPVASEPVLAGAGRGHVLLLAALYSASRTSPMQWFRSSCFR